MILSGVTGDQSGTLRISHEAHRFSRNREPALDLWTNRKEFNILGQGVRDEGIAAVSTVVSDVLAQEARADSEFDLLFHDDYHPLTAGKPNPPATIERSTMITAHLDMGVKVCGADEPGEITRVNSDYPALHLRKYS